MPDVDIVPVGDTAAIALLGDSIDPAVVRRAWSLADVVRRRLGANALDVVPAYASVLVRFDPDAIGLAQVMACLRGAYASGGSPEMTHARYVSVGVCFGGESGADLEETAAAVGLTPHLYIEVFCAAEYRVAFLGFLAGFPYLIGLPPELAAPRRPAPRDRVPPGSVAIAGEQCGIYPRSSPGGWRLLGTTHASIFNPTLVPPALFAPGDRVRFEPVDRPIDATVEIEA
jgi:KipI family sensor histidine kinase inhibitor